MQHVLVFIFIIVKCTPLAQLTIENNGPALFVRDHKQSIGARFYRLAAESCILVKCYRGSRIRTATVYFTERFQSSEYNPTLFIRSAISYRNILTYTRFMRTYRLFISAGREKDQCSYRK